MNKLVILFFLNCVVTFAQSNLGTANTYNPDYVAAEVFFNDGHSENGYVYGFIDRRYIEAMNPFKSTERVEDEMNLSDSWFQFRHQLTDKDAVKLTSNEVKRVKVQRSKGGVDDYWLMNLKTINTKGEMVDMKKKVWLPLYQEGKINMFTYDVYYYGQGETTFNTIIYLNNSKNNDALLPIDLDTIGMFTASSKIENRKLAILKKVFEDCPAYIELINKDSKFFLSERFKTPFEIYKERYAVWKSYKGLPKKERNKLSDDFQRSANIDPFVKCITEYNQICPN